MQMMSNSDKDSIVSDLYELGNLVSDYATCPEVGKVCHDCQLLHMIDKRIRGIATKLEGYLLAKSQEPA